MVFLILRAVQNKHYIPILPLEKEAQIGLQATVALGGGTLYLLV